MPIVPVYNRQPVQQERLPNVKVSTEAPIQAFGGGTEGMQRAFGKAVDSAFDLYKEEKTRSRNVIARRQKELIDQKLQADLYDPQKGYLTTRKGALAINVSAEATQSFDDWYNSHRSSQTWDSETQYMVDTYWMDAKTNATKQLNVHESGELDNLDTQSLNSFIENKKTIAALGATDDTAVEANKKQMLDEIKNSIQIQRMGPDVVKFRLDKELSEFRYGHITSLLASGYNKKAKDTFAKYENEMNPEHRKALKKALELDDKTKEAFTIAAALFKKGGTDLNDINEDINKISDPKLLEEVQQQYYRMVGNAERFKGIEVNENVKKLKKQMQNNGGDMSKVDPILVEWIVANGKNGDDIVKNIRQYAMNGNNTITDEKVKADLTGMSEKDFVEKWSSEEEKLKYLTKLSPEDRAKFDEKYNKAISGGKKEAEENKESVVKEGLKFAIDNNISGIKSIDPSSNKYGGMTMEIQAALRRAYEKKIEEKKASGKPLMPLTKEEVNGLYIDVFANKDIQASIASINTAPDNYHQSRPAKDFFVKSSTSDRERIASDPKLTANMRARYLNEGASEIEIKRFDDEIQSIQDRLTREKDRLDRKKKGSKKEKDNSFKLNNPDIQDYEESGRLKIKVEATLSKYKLDGYNIRSSKVDESIPLVQKEINKYISDYKDKNRDSTGNKWNPPKAHLDLMLEDMTFPVKIISSGGLFGSVRSMLGGTAPSTYVPGIAVKKAQIESATTDGDKLPYRVKQRVVNMAKDHGVVSKDTSVDDAFRDEKTASKLERAAAIYFINMPQSEKIRLYKERLKGN